MFSQTQALRKYLKRRQDIIDAGKPQEQELITNNLFNEKTFYRAFIKDMLEAEEEIIIYCPFISKFRSDFFRKTLKELKRRNINVFIFTRPLEEHEYFTRSEIKCALGEYEDLGVCIFYLEGSMHEKVAIIDRKILWEGSLNILSQRSSREIMRRISDENSAMQILLYLGLNKKLIEGYKLRYEKLCKGLVVNSKNNLRLKIFIFSLGLAIPIIIWWLLFFTKSVLSWLRFF